MGTQPQLMGRPDSLMGTRPHSLCQLVGSLHQLVDSLHQLVGTQPQATGSLHQLMGIPSSVGSWVTRRGRECPSTLAEVQRRTPHQRPRQHRHRHRLWTVHVHLSRRQSCHRAHLPRRCGRRACAGRRVARGGRRGCRARPGSRPPSARTGECSPTPAAPSFCPAGTTQMQRPSGRYCAPCCPWMAMAARTTTAPSDTRDRDISNGLNSESRNVKSRSKWTDPEPSTSSSLWKNPFWCE